MAGKYRADFRASVALAALVRCFHSSPTCAGRRGASRRSRFFLDQTVLRGLGKTKRLAGRTNFCAAFSSLGLAFSSLRWRGRNWAKRLTQVEASGIDIMLVLDVSGSMLIKDFTIGGDPATRIDAIREVTRKFIEGRPNDRIGLIAFAGRPYVVSPMTLDHDWLIAKSRTRSHRPGRRWNRDWVGHGRGCEPIE